MLIKMKNFISVACSVLALLNVMADTEPKILRDVAYVDAQYYGDETGGFHSPYNTIQEAIDNVASNGTVVVAPGTYHESLMLTNFPIRLIASGCATNTTITSADWSWSNANASRIFISPSASGSVVAGFCVTGGNGNSSEADYYFVYGGGFLCEGSVEIKDCIITYNGDASWGWHYGGGIYVSGNDIEVKAINCLFEYNVADYGAAAYVADSYESDASVLVLDRCTFFNNDWDNYDDEHGAIYADGNGRVICKNSIFLDNGLNSIIGGSGTMGDVSISYSCIQGGVENIKAGNITDGGGNISDDPMFTDQYDTYSLEESSPCRDAGDPETPLDPDGTCADMGFSIARFHCNITNANDFVYELCSDGAYITEITNNTSHVEVPMFLEGCLVVGIGCQNFNDGEEFYYSLNPFTTPKDVVSIRLPYGVKRIGGFESCTKLKELDIPNGVVHVGSFDGCAALEKVCIPSTLQQIGSFGFDTTWVSPNVEFIVSEDNAYYSSDDMGSLFEKDKKVLFRGCTRKLHIGNSDYRLPDTLESIEDNAFIGLQPSWARLYLPASVTNIHYRAFVGVKNFAVNIDELNQCYSSSSYENNKVIYNKDRTILYHHLGNDNVPSDFTIPSSVTNVESMAFAASYGLRTVRIPDSVTKWGSYVFDACWDLKHITLPKNIETIGMFDFVNCKSLVSVEMQEGSQLKNIYDHAFQGCSNLTTVVLKEGLQRLMCAPFADCTSLTDVIIPSTVEALGQPFSNCTSLTNISFHGVPPTDLGWWGKAGDTGNPNTVGYYRPKYAKEWEAVLDDEGRWDGLLMRKKAMLDNKVTFVVGDKGLHTGGGSLEQDVFDETAAESPLITANEGWHFVGWDADISCVISNVIVSAVYKRGAVYISLEANGGMFADGSIVTQECEDIYLAFPVATREGYVFDGWYLGVTNGAPKAAVGASLLADDDHTLFAKWQIDETLMPGGASIFAWEAIAANTVRITGFKDSAQKVSTLLLPDMIEGRFVTEIAAGAFANSKSDMTKLLLPMFCTKIGDKAFTGVTSLSEIVFADVRRWDAPSENGSLAIGRYAFSGAGVEAVTLPKSVGAIGDYAFANCRKLTNLTILGTPTVGVMLLLRAGLDVGGVTVHLDPVLANDSAYMEALKQECGNVTVRADAIVTRMTLSSLAMSASEIELSVSVEKAASWGKVDTSLVKVAYRESLSEKPIMLDPSSVTENVDGSLTVKVVAPKGNSGFFQVVLEK